MGPAIPIIMAITAIASVATSVYELTQTPSAPTPPATTPASQTQQSQAQLESAYAEAQQLRQRRGYDSTILTGPQGVTGSLNPYATTGKTVLG